MAPYLPEDLILEIFLRLEVKSLLRFRCVCKKWKTLISDPKFAKDHFRTSTMDPNMTRIELVTALDDYPCIMVFCPVQSLFRKPSTPGKYLCLRPPIEIHILGSCNGLLCLLTSDGHLKLWNPCTRLTSKRLSIDFSFGSSVTLHGFGYDHVNDKYKVLVIVDDTDQYECKLCTFGENSLKLFPLPGLFLYSFLGKYVSGTLNWVNPVSSPDKLVILSLDLTKEIYGQVLTPDLETDEIFNPVLEILRNCLCLCYFDFKKAHSVLWLMKEYGVQESWTKLMMIPLVEVGRWNCFEPLCISGSGVVLLRNYASILVLYNPNDGKFDYPRSRSDHWTDNLHIFHRSLISPPR